MDLAKILCSSPRQGDEEMKASTLMTRSVESLHGQVSQEMKLFQFVPDKERKRPYRMSATQKQRRREHEEFESHIYNLTLDINDLRQQIQLLNERKDLYVMRLLLHRQHAQSHMLKVTWDLFSSYRSDSHGLTPSGRGTLYSNGVLQFAMERGTPAFTHRSFDVKYLRVLALIDDDDVSCEHAQEIRKVCGTRQGCSVEVLVNFTGRIVRKTIATMFPLILRDEALTSQLIGLNITFTSRHLLFFDGEQRLVKQIMQADIIKALNALHVGGANGFAAFAGLEQHESG